MRYEPHPLSNYERMFIVGASFSSGAVFLYEGNRLAAGSFPIHAYVFYLATLTIFLSVVLRYFISVRIFHTEQTLWAWCLSMSIAFSGWLSVHAATLGPGWMLYTIVLLFLGNLKTNQARKAIRVNQLFDEQQKQMLARIQSGILWFQSELALVLFLCWMATTVRFGNPLASHWFGVTDFQLWNTGVATVGGIVCLARSAVLGVRVLVWHREYLQMFPHTTTYRKIESSEMA